MRETVRAYFWKYLEVISRLHTEFSLSHKTRRVRGGDKVKSMRTKKSEVSIKIRFSSVYTSIPAISVTCQSHASATQFLDAS